MNVVVTDITATSISLSWSVVGGSVARSEVVWRETDRATESSSGSLTGTSYTIDQLESTTIYTVTVRASNATDSHPIIVSTCMLFLIELMSAYIELISPVPTVSEFLESANIDTCSCSKDHNLVAIIGGVLAVVVISALVVIVIVVLVLICRRRSYSIKVRCVIVN